MSVKKSVSLSAQTVQSISSRSLDDSIVWSRGINNLISAYEHIVSTSVPRLNQNEWKLLYTKLSDVLNKPTSFPVNLALTILYQTGSVSVESLRVTEPKTASLIEKLSHFNQTEQIALVDRLKQYHSKNRR